MNAGGNFGDFGSAVETVTLMDSDGNVFEKSKPELVFDYRRTNITAKFILTICIIAHPSCPLCVVSIQSLISLSNSAVDVEINVFTFIILIVKYIINLIIHSYKGSAFRHIFYSSSSC